MGRSRHNGCARTLYRSIGVGDSDASGFRPRSEGTDIALSRHVRIDPFRHEALRAELVGMSKHDRALFHDVFVKDNPILAAAQHRQRFTAGEEGPLS